jgi:hypothetical protein
LPGYQIPYIYIYNHVKYLGYSSACPYPTSYYSDESFFDAASLALGFVFTLWIGNGFSRPGSIKAGLFGLIREGKKEIAPGLHELRQLRIQEDEDGDGRSSQGKRISETNQASMEPTCEPSEPKVKG